MTLSVQCDGLSAGWADRVLIRGFGEQARFDEINNVLPITGETGIGKSTLLYALSAMARPLHGSVSWDFPGAAAPVTWSGHKDSFNSINHLRRHNFGFLLQDTRMIDCFTVEENLRHTLRLRGVHDDIEARVAKAVRDMAIRESEVSDLPRSYPVALSGGQRQRMALAVAIAHDPIVLFADEPTASLDDKTAIEVLGKIRQWLDEEKGQRAFVLVTHRLETLKAGIGAEIAWNMQLDEAGYSKAVEQTLNPHRMAYRAVRAGKGSKCGH